MTVVSKLIRTSPKPQEFFKGSQLHHMAGVPYNPNVFFGNGTGFSSQPVIIVRAEEALIVILVLALWIAAIALFFNRWGKIRMLEPYQPKFIQQHRPSCPLVDQVQHRSFSKYNINNDVFLNHQKTLRPRQNSVFVSSMMNLPMNAPRKVKSAFDLQNLVLSDPALNKSAVRFYPDGDYFRRSSLFPVNPRKRLGDADQTDIPQPSGERRLSFKDLVEIETSHLQKCERLQCYPDKEPADPEFSRRNRKIGETKQRSTISTQSSLSDSRHNSITNPDLKFNLCTSGKMSTQERRNSLMPIQREFSPNSDGNELRAELKVGVNNFRRNSMLLINSVENEKNILNPRENIKSGVVDFRRNSMLIINNLTEDMGYRSAGRNYSLGGSNIVLNADFPLRRNSVIPPYCNEPGKKLSVPHVSVPKAKSPNVKPSILHSGESKHLGTHKPSKSLDCADSGKTTSWKKKEASQPSLFSEGKQQFLTPTVPQNFTGSSASLNDYNFTVKKLTPETRSTCNLNPDATHPKIVQTKCYGPVANKELTASSTNFRKQPTEEVSEEPTEQKNASKTFDAEKVTVNVTTSLTNLNITSTTPLNLTTSSETVENAAHAIHSSHV